MQLHKNIKVIISGGGTGGHIFPAIAIANALKAIDASVDLLFVGAEGKMEMEKVPAAGYKIEGLTITGIKRELSFSNLSFPLKLIRSLNKAGTIINKFQPDVAVGVGGYASGPLLYMASRKKIPSLIQEQNSYPGITNKLLSKSASSICVAYEGMEKYFPADKIIFTGNPVREDIKNIEGKKSEAAEFFNLNIDIPTILIVGGSQGARSINNAILAGLSKIANSGVQLIWQTGKTFLSEAKEAIAKLKSNSLHAFDFISRMDLAYAMSDLVLARAGASTVSELCIVKKPAILIPLPTAAEDHQTKNCMSLVNRNAAILINDADALHKLVDEALLLINNYDLLKTLKENIAPLARPFAANEIAQHVLSLVRNK